MTARARRRAALGAAVVAVGIAATAWLYAAVTTSNLSVSATVIRNCTISTAAVAFGAYDPVVANATSALDASGSITVACTKGTASTIGLGAGQNASGTTRRMAAGGEDLLTYGLYLDSTRTIIWGDAAGALLETGAAPSKAPRTFDVYGRVAPGQDVPAGAFTDVVVATVNF